MSTEAVEFDQHVLLNHSTSDDAECYLLHTQLLDHGGECLVVDRGTRRGECDTASASRANRTTGDMQARLLTASQCELAVDVGDELP